MSLLSAVKAQNVVTNEQDSLGGFTVPTNTYQAVLRIAYMDKSARGALSVNLDFEILANGKGRRYLETIYISDASGSVTRKDKDGNTVPTFGYEKVDSICKAALGKSLAELDEAVMKKVKVGKDKVDDREVLMELNDAKLILGISEQIENKSVKNESTGNWDPVAETRETNQISKVFDVDGLTTVERVAKQDEPKFMNDWVARFAGKRVDKTKKIAGAVGMVAGGVSAASAATAINVFG